MEDLARPARSLSALLALAALLPAQAKSTGEAQPDPMAIVSAAERELQRPDKDVEAAILMLWEALDLLADRPSNAILEATTLSARYLLQQHDPREAERRRVFTQVAKLQVELATAYRGKKWFESAKTRLDVADSYDKDVGAKERAALLAALPKPAANAPAVAKPEPKSALGPALQRAKAKFAHGTWTEAGDHLQSPLTPVNDIAEWVTNEAHADHEIVMEFQAVDATKDHNIALSVGVHLEQASNSYDGIRVQCFVEAKEKTPLVRVWQITGKDFRDLKSEWVTPRPVADGWHRLAVQVRGNRVRVTLDDCAAIDAEAKGDVRGVLGLAVCNPEAQSPPVRIRTLRVDPLPADQPSDDEVRAAAESARQNAITKAVEDAKGLLAKKQPEPAALTLRDALAQIDAMTPGVLRDNLQKTVMTMLGTADPLTPKRVKAASDIGASLLALADQYAKAGQVRCALAMTHRAAGFLPDDRGPVAKAEEAVRQWNVEQAQKRAAELAPPKDDGAQLQQWFAKGTRLDSRRPEWAHGDGVVSLPDARDTFSVLMSTREAPPLGKASVYVHLPAANCWAGFAFDVVGPGEYSIAIVSREAKGLVAAIECYKDGKWRTAAERRAPLDAWRLDGWFPLEIGETATGVTLKAGGLELQAERAKLLPVASRFGLAAGNAGDAPRTIGFRAFTRPQ